MQYVLSNFIIDWSIKKKVPVGYFYVTTRSPCYFTQVSICEVQFVEPRKKNSTIKSRQIAANYLQQPKDIYYFFTN
jgi:hypothetical protein